MSCVFDNPVNLAHVWRAGELGSASTPTVATGFAGLDQALPGGGWPCASLTEVLQPQAGRHEWGLLLPALVAAQKASPDSWTLLVGAPHVPFAPPLGAQDFNLQRLLRVRAENNDAPALLWATREALQCADVGTVIAWLPDVRSAHLRRLQIAAHTHHKLLFVFRLLAAQHESSPAPLRLILQAENTPVGSRAGQHQANMRVTIFKRRGPPLDAPVWIDTRPQRLTAFLAASQAPSHRTRPRQASPALPANAPSALIDLSDLLRKPLYALDRIASPIH